MAANDPHPRFDQLPPRAEGSLTPTALRERLEEEISRAERHGTQLSCLLVVVENLREMTSEHGSELREQTLDYVAEALRRQLRRFDRVGRDRHDGRDASAPEQDVWQSDHDLLIILPGADGLRAEIVARRALERLRTIKIEARGTRWPLHISVGLAAWRADISAESLLEQAREAVRPANGESPAAAPESAISPEREQAGAAGLNDPGVSRR
jgi:GGDEF domain-containing protein